MRLSGEGRRGLIETGAYYNLAKHQQLTIHFLQFIHSCRITVITIILQYEYRLYFSQSSQVLYLYSCTDWYGKNVPVIQSIVHCLVVKEKVRARDERRGARCLKESLAGGGGGVGGA